MVPHSGYRWVVATNVLELDSPSLWHSHFIDGSPSDDKAEPTLGTRVVREYAGRIIVVDSFPVLDVESPQWHFYGWVLPSSEEIVLEYSQISLTVEVLTATEEPVLYKIYDLDRTTLPTTLIEKGFSDEEEESDYAFLVLIEGHSRATLLKHMCKDIEEFSTGLFVERIREDSESLDIFGSFSFGSWSISTKLSRVRGTYETQFKLWREGRISSNYDRNNPTITSEEEQYFEGTSSRGELLYISTEHLRDSIQAYMNMPIENEIEEDK